MSEEAAAPNPADGMLLTSSKEGGGDFVKIGLIGGGAALLAYGLFGRKGKKEKGKEGAKEGKSAEVRPDEVVFGKGLESYQVGPTWRSKVLEPYLEDAAEESSLVTRGWEGEDMGGYSPDSVALYMEHTRKKILEAFYKSYTVKVPKGTKVIVSLDDTEAVRAFKAEVEGWTEEFQESF